MANELSSDVARGGDFEREVGCREAWNNELADWLDHGTYRHYARLRILENLYQEESFSRLLDIGCGSGALLEHFSERSVHCVGFDLSQNIMAYHQKRAAFPGFVGSVEQIPLVDDTFDMLTCLGLIEHLADPVAALREMKRVVRLGGRAMITVPRRLGVFPILVPAWYFSGGRHRYGWKNMVGTMYTQAMLREQLTQAGWVTESIGAFKASSVLEWLHLPYSEKMADYVEGDTWARKVLSIMLVAICRKPDEEV
jgi:ubiquinone/menaquinone biosynthesis C-methylase UbiE